MDEQSKTSSNTLTNQKIYEALSKAQGEFPVIPKDSEVEVKKDGKLLYKYKYADLTAIISATRPAMTKHGLGFNQDLIKHPDLGVTGFITTIHHSSGETIRVGFVPCTISGNQDMKVVAGLYTYGKRISLTAALGVSADEDMDAASNEVTSGNSTKKSDIQKPVRNYAPASEPFDQYMQPEPPEDDERSLLISELRSLVDTKSIPHDKVSGMIKLATGRTARSTELSVDELNNVINYINL